MRKIAILLPIFFLLIVMSSLIRVRRPPSPVDYTIAYIKSGSVAFYNSTNRLLLSIELIKTADSRSVQDAKDALKTCRMRYKRIEYFLEYFFHGSTLIYNRPPKYEMEEPFLEYEAPRGLQVIEALLFDRNAFRQKGKLVEQARAINESAKDLPALFYHCEIHDDQLLECLRLELIRMMTLGITGFDAPLLQSGISESSESLQSIQTSIEPYLLPGTPISDSVSWYLKRSAELLHATSDFYSFDRLGFLTNAAMPLQYHLGRLIKSLHAELHTVAALNYDAPNLFSRGAINMNAFPGAIKDQDTLVQQLGQKLFFENMLSGNGTRSCATCHRPGAYFSEHMSTSASIDQHASLTRNAPTLLYAGFQYSQFADGRVRSLEDQVTAVMLNHLEMNADTVRLIQRLLNDDKYRGYFEKAFIGQGNPNVSFNNIATSLGAFIRSLQPMNSAFDQFVSGNTKALTTDQKAGFNLFMGKAQCGTCHFAPLFNGLTPPLYANSEYENLGVPLNDDWNHPRPDPDLGRFGRFPIRFNEKLFKTPTIRNSAVTWPYMHNGSFYTLKKILDFYNKGGGQGLGLHEPEQTLSPKPLQLTQKEMNQIISFLQATTDSLCSFVNTR